MGIFIVILIVAIIVKFIFALNKDKGKLKDRFIDEVFSETFNVLNQTVFQGEGIIRRNNQRESVLLTTEYSSTIFFLYGTGNLHIKWISSNGTWKKTYYNVARLDSEGRERLGWLIAKDHMMDDL